MSLKCVRGQASVCCIAWSSGACGRVVDREAVCLDASVVEDIPLEQIRRSIDP